jgi:hypothetical protein
VAKKKVSPTDERAVAFRWLSNVIAEAEQELERLGLRRDSWQAIKIDLDALDRRSPRLVQVLEYRSETNDRTGRQTEWRGDDLTVLLNSRRRRDRARTQRAQAAAVRARAAHTALLLCEKFDSVMAALRREASANAAAASAMRSSRRGLCERKEARREWKERRSDRTRARRP